MRSSDSWQRPDFSHWAKDIVVVHPRNVSRLAVLVRPSKQRGGLANEALSLSDGVVREEFLVGSYGVKIVRNAHRPMLALTRQPATAVCLLAERQLWQAVVASKLFLTKALELRLETIPGSQCLPIRPGPQEHEFRS